MDIVDELRAFVATAQTGSFTAAAEQLGVSNRLTSKYVAELEARLGVRLFQRTTRRVGMTPAGEDLLARAPALLDDLDGLLAEVAEGSRGFSGVIRLSAPVTFGETYVAPMLDRFGRENPGLTFDLRLSDRYDDLAKEGLDLAFRMGRSEMLSLKARKLGATRAILVASPAYLAAQGRPETLEELSRHACIVDTNRRAPRRWTLEAEGTPHVVQVQGRFHVNSARAVVQLTENGQGIAYAPRFALGEALASGRLVRVMEAFHGPSTPLAAVYLEGRALPRKLRALIEFAAEDIKTAHIL
ncbi:LysR family transcriptional regulator [Pseudothioclava arenosa]|uniref:LysR family transcriptional regulator n=1 Tax=Pseudothioclava arenosa TaxID=1795308 RepID=A0A2A4CT25_9RHOB|nr:LysR family transcriptional regulator [Pseudothioclava arenosa]PCD77286.1 LysR family transcriptional regulator [Pseudothioclava arenosa]